MQKTNNKNVADVRVGRTPEAIAVNPNENTVYVANFGLGGSVTVIDGQTNKVAAGVTFNINPTDSGQIICNKNVSASTNQFLYIGLGTQCTALPNKGFEFSSWVENSAHNSTKIIGVSTVSESPLNPILDIFGLKPIEQRPCMLLSLGLISKPSLIQFRQHIGFPYMVLLLVR